MLTVWRLKKFSDKRLRSGHPWVFSNELQESPKGLASGTAVKVLDASGAFLAYGYGNPNSLIAFRATSFVENDQEFFTADTLAEKLVAAWKMRKNLGYEASFRLCFSEADGVAGLIVDRYLVHASGKRHQVFAVQVLTKGMETWMGPPEKVIHHLVEKSHALGISDLDWSVTAVVLRNDVNIRKLEGMEVEEPRVLHPGSIGNLENVQIQLQSQAQAPLLMSVDLIKGQKTGFFLDQTYNIALVSQLLKNGLGKKKVRILDLCCYMGHWSAQLAHLLKEKGVESEVTLLDVSDLALKKAAENLQRVGAEVILEKRDVLDQLGDLQRHHYDIVVADPPAFIKAKKDVPTGKHAYLKLNTNAFQLVASGGLLVSCSCSGLLIESEFHEILNKASRRAGRRVRCLLRGGNAPDHPSLLGFPEGSYLKMITHSIE